jgi:CheY-like chemotaxis protein
MNYNNGDQMQQPKILIVEDNMIASKTAQMLLESKACRVDCVFTGQAALSQIENQYDLILLDLGLPDMHGFEVAKIIKNSNALLAMTPIAIVTAFDSKESRKLAKKLGIKHYLSKPFTLEKCDFILKEMALLQESECLVS